MKISLSVKQLQSIGLNEKDADSLSNIVTSICEAAANSEEAWQTLSKTVLHLYPFSVHLYLFNLLFPSWEENKILAPLWIPRQNEMIKTNLFQWMNQLNISDVTDFHQWSIQHYQTFWKTATEKLHIQFKQKPDMICDLTNGIESPSWFPGAMMNITDSCFTAPPSKTALIYHDEMQNIKQMSYGELYHLTNCIANSLIAHQIKPGDAIAIAMPMNQYATAIYLAIIKTGAIVVSIADSFSTQEIAVRLEITQTKLIFTQDIILRGNKQLPLYEKVKAAAPIQAIVLPAQDRLSIELSNEDHAWDQFLLDHAAAVSVSVKPMTICNILFSSGTTGTPKAIPWNHTTPIKAACDAYLHLDIQSNDILAWPTNLGWMMGPWLIFASLINQATIALYNDVPKDENFGKFVEKAKVTMLGVVPTLVSTWRESQCMEELNWQSIKRFSSTGECSNPEDMLYLSSLAHYQPIIEYCGGTEIGGAYVTSTMIQKNCPSLFSTKAMGLDFVLLDESQHLSTVGEVALIPPSIGLSVTLLNANHHDVYYAGMPKPDKILLRRHGDQIHELPNHYYCLLGRVDDTMNLGGIKISSAEIERALAGIPEITEVAAVACHPPLGGPSQLVIYAATTHLLNRDEMMQIMQKKINSHLNPLFKIHDLVFIENLPKTASNKIIRRELRKHYRDKM